MPEVKQRQVVFVNVQFDGNARTATFRKNFHLTFAPDDMIVRSVCCGTEDVVEDVHTINMNGVGDIFHFTSGTQAPNLVFNVAGRSLAGEQTFTVRGINGNLDDTLLNSMIFALEFVEFAR